MYLDSDAEELPIVWCLDCDQAICGAEIIDHVDQRHRIAEEPPFFTETEAYFEELEKDAGF